MEPLKINIEVSLSEATIAALKGIFGAQIIAAPAKVEEPAPEPKKAAKKAEPAPAPQPQPAPAPTVDDDDLPPDDAPAPTPKPTPTEADARAAVKAAKDRGVPPKAVRAFMQEHFGITTSVDCPEDRRQELIDGLNNLAA